MTDDSADNDDGRVSITYRIRAEAKQALADYAKSSKLSLRSALDHILLCIDRNPDAIPKPTQYSARLTMGTNGETVSIAACSVCLESFSPAEHGDSIEALVEWSIHHKQLHAKKG